MNIAKIESAYKHGNSAAFKEAADYLTKTQVFDPTNGPVLTTEARAVISEVMAGDMATGAELMRPRYVLIGGLIGIAIVITVLATAKISNEIKKRRA